VERRTRCWSTNSARHDSIGDAEDIAWEEVLLGGRRYTTMYQMERRTNQDLSLQNTHDEHHRAILIVDVT
jgi:hypothetical protein